MLVQKDQNSAELYATQYDRSRCSIGIVHIGYGAFHRAHQAVYIDDYMEQSGNLNWAIAAVNLRASEASTFKHVQDVKNGYLLKTTSPQGERELRLVRSHCQFLDWSTDKDSAEDLVALKSVHAITITVTESGYYLNDDFSLDEQNPTIISEIRDGQTQSAYAYLTCSLRRRFEAGGQPINVMCCDNIRSNGTMLHRNFNRYLELIGDDELYNWVQENVAFPCSMVDRITPRASDELNTEITGLFGMEAYSPIHAEKFSQWVLKDDFKAPIPNLATVGVEIVQDVDPYEEAKIRILNGGHTGLCYLGALAGLTTFDQTMHNAELKSFFNAYERNEVLPGLDIELPFDKFAYLDEIADRFSNIAIADQLERICMDGFSKMPIFIRPTLSSCLRQGITPINGILCVASWYVYARRFASGQMPIHYHEVFWDQLEPLLAVGCEEKFARTKQLWADLPDQYPDFVTELVSAIQEIEEKWPV